MITISNASPLEQKLTITNDATDARLTVWFFRSFPIAFSVGDSEDGKVLKENTLGLKEADVLKRLGGEDTNLLPQDEFSLALEKAEKILHG